MPTIGFSSGEFFQQLACLIPPFSVLVLHGTAYKFIAMRNLVREELDAAYVLNSLSGGLTERRILFTHILINTLPAFFSLVALNVGFMIGGTLLVEVVFFLAGEWAP